MILTVTAKKWIAKKCKNIGLAAVFGLVKSVSNYCVVITQR